MAEIIFKETKIGIVFIYEGVEIEEGRKRKENFDYGISCVV